MKKVLIVGYADLQKDPRPYRQINALYKDYEVHSIGASPSGLEFKFHKLVKMSFLKVILRLPLLKIGLYEKYYWDSEKKKTLNEVRKLKFDLIIANEIRSLPLAVQIAGSSPVIFDAHEYSPENYNDFWPWRFLFKNYLIFLCEKYIPMASCMTTVSSGLVDLYLQRFQVKPSLINNACEFHELEARKLGDKIKIIHHGIVCPTRNLHLLIEMMDYLDERYELYFMLLYSESTKWVYLKLRKLAEKHPRIFFLNPVSREEIVPFSNKFDIGVAFFPPTNSNLKYALPNKFFEYVQSRLVLAIGPDFEMSKYVKKHDLGIISEEWTARSLASAISSKSKDQLYQIKKNVHFSANELSSHGEMKKLSSLVSSLI